MSNDPFDSDALRRAREQLDKTFDEQARTGTTFSELARRTHETLNGPAGRELERIRRDPSQTFLREHIEKLYNSDGLTAISAAARRVQENNDRVSSAMAEVQKGLDAQRFLAWENSDLFRALREVSERQRETSLSIIASLEPYKGFTANLANAMANLVPISDRLSVAGSVWEETLSRRVGGLKMDWLTADLSVSIVGFSHMTRMSEVVRTEHPFSPEAVDLYADELGDLVEEEGSPEEREEAALAAGFNPGLVAFKEEHYAGVLIQAGFKVRLPPLVAPIALENADPTASFSSAHRDLIEHLEHNLRLVFAAGFARMQGNIKGNVDPDVQKNWGERRDLARSKGRPVYELIYYADFSDFAQMIQRRKVWEEVMQPFFPYTSQDDVRVSLLRLHPIRNDLGHTRPIGRSDQLLLFNESTRILTALGLNILV